MKSLNLYTFRFAKANARIDFCASGIKPVFTVYKGVMRALSEGSMKINYEIDSIYFGAALPLSSAKTF